MDKDLEKSSENLGSEYLFSNFSNSTNFTCQSQFTQSEKDVLLYVYGGMGGLAVCFCILGMIMVIYWRLYKRFIHRLILYQLFSGLLFSFICMSNLIFIDYEYHVDIYRPICAAVGYFMTMSIWIKLFFTFWLTFHLFAFSVCLKDLRKLEPIYIATSLIFPLLFCWVPFLHGLYGESGAWCWIKNWKKDCANEKVLLGTIEQYVFVFAIGTVFFIIDFVFIILTIFALLCHSHNSQSDEVEPLLREEARKRKKALKELLPLMAYPIIFMLLFIPPFVNRVYGALVPTTHFFLFILHAATGPSWGLFVGLTVIVHICVMKCFSETKNKLIVHCSANNKGNQQQQGNNVRSDVHATDVFTTETIASTNARTDFIFSRDSLTIISEQ